jgi:DNA-binding response OmpR family regulator
MAQLLVVEDDPTIRRALLHALSDRGHAVDTVGTAADALRTVVEARPDLVVLDLGLPDISGYEVLRMMRAVSRVPVVVATAQDDEQEIIKVLDAGADDYLVKPFSPGQLDARIRAVLRRGGPAADAGPPVLSVGGLELDPRSRVARLDGTPLDLSPREFDLLHYLAAHADEVVTKRDLLTHVWRLPYGGADKTVDAHLSWLRRKLGENAANPRFLHTVRGVGVRLASSA